MTNIQIKVIGQFCKYIPRYILPRFFYNLSFGLSSEYLAKQPQIYQRRLVWVSYFRGIDLDTRMSQKASFNKFLLFRKTKNQTIVSAASQVTEQSFLHSAAHPLIRRGLEKVSRPHQFDQHSPAGRYLHQQVCSSGKMVPMFFVRLCKVWRILHHVSVGRVIRKTFFNAFITLLWHVLLFFIIKFVFLSFSFFLFFIFLTKYQISTIEYYQSEV